MDIQSDPETNPIDVRDRNHTTSIKDKVCESFLFTPRGINRWDQHRFCGSIFHLVYMQASYCYWKHFCVFCGANVSCLLCCLFILLLCCSGLFMRFICLLIQMWPIHSEISNCVIKREEERCFERIALQDPKNDEKFGKREQRLSNTFTVSSIYSIICIQSISGIIWTNLVCNSLT